MSKKLIEHVRNNLVDDFVCYAGTYDMSIILRYPEDRQIETSLQDKDVSSPLASYESHYALDGHTLHVSRHFLSRVTSQKCTGDEAKSFENVIKMANRDIALRLDFSPR